MANFIYQPYKSSKKQKIKNIKDIEKAYNSKDYSSHNDACTCEKCRKTD